MENFSYAHNDTSSGERETPTSKFNTVNLGEKIREIRDSAFSRGIPTADDETLNFLITLLSAVQPENVLELGTAIGISGSVMLDVCKNARLTTIERDENFYKEATLNFEKLNLTGRVTAVLGDAGEEIEALGGNYDFIFLDCAKAQYVKYLPRLKLLLKRGGILLADDVLLFGWLTGEAEVPKKRKMLAKHVEEFLQELKQDEGFFTTVINIGDGLSLSVKK